MKTETKRVTYIKCGYCTAKNHCKECGEGLGQSLEEKALIYSALVNLPSHTLQITHDLSDLEDILDAMGLLVE